MTASQEGAFRRAMECHRANIASRIAQKAQEAGLFPSDHGIPDLVSVIETNLGVWLDAIEDQESSKLESATVESCSQIRSQAGDMAAALQLLELTGQLLLDAVLMVLDDGIDGAEQGVQGVLHAWASATSAYERAFRATYEALAERTAILRDIAERAPIGIGISTPGGDFTYMNAAHRKMLGFGEDEVIGKNIQDILAPEERQMIPNVQHSGAAMGPREGIMRVVRSDGSIMRVYTTTFWVFTEQGEPIARCAFVRDMTDEERAEEEREALERQIVEAQDEALRELGTPLLPISDRVLAMPIVGTIDNARAMRSIEVMLSEITRTGAGHVIVDITGVPRVTAEVAEMILRAAKAAELVGTEMVLTGIRGTVAKTLLELGVSLAGMETQSTLRAGVAHALAHEREKLRAERPRK